MKELVFTGRVLPASEDAALGLVTKLSNTPVDDAMALAHKLAGRSPDAVRGAKKLINRMSNTGAADHFAADHFAAERQIIFRLVGSANQVEAITANFENRAPKFEDVGSECSPNTSQVVSEKQQPACVNGRAKRS